MDEKIGTVIIDGKIVDIDKLSLKDLKELKAKVDKKENEIRKKIDNILSNER